MLVEARPRTEEEELERIIRRQVVQRTWGRVLGLEVELSDGRVTVHGRSPSYYVKQLALQAVREVLDLTPIRLDIEVVPYARRPVPEPEAQRAGS